MDGFGRDAGFRPRYAGDRRRGKTRRNTSFSLVAKTILAIGKPIMRAMMAGADITRSCRTYNAEGNLFVV